MNELRLPDLFDLDPMPSAFRDLWRPWRGEAAERTPQIRIDLSETDKAYAVKAEIPGVKKEDIDVLELRLPKKAQSAGKRLAVG